MVLLSHSEKTSQSVSVSRPESVDLIFFGFYAALGIFQLLLPLAMKTGRERNSQCCSCFQVTHPQVAQNVWSVKQEMKYQGSVSDDRESRGVNVDTLAKPFSKSEKLLVMRFGAT